MSSLPPRSMGTSGTERSCSWSFVPFLNNRTCLGPCRIPGLASRIGTNGIFCIYRFCHGKFVSTPIFQYAHLHQILCYLFPLGRAVRSSQTRKRGATHFFFLFLNICCFSRAAHNLFVSSKQPAPMHAANVFDSVRSNALMGGVTPFRTAVPFWG